MLVSALIGFIMGIGMSLGTHQASTFKTALPNLGIAAGISIHGRNWSRIWSRNSRRFLHCAAEETQDHLQGLLS